MIFGRRKPPAAPTFDRKAFLKLLAKRFYPELRKEGFKGSGRTLRRIDEPLVHVFNVQASHGGDGFYINLGANLTYLYPTIATNTRGSDCAFRERLDPPTRYPNRMWPYAYAEAEANALIDEVIREWSGPGRAFFETYATYPDSFERLIRETDFGQIHPGHVLKHAEIARQLGHEDTAKQAVADAIPRLGGGATAVLRDMKAFLEGPRDPGSSPEDE